MKLSILQEQLMEKSFLIHSLKFHEGAPSLYFLSNEKNNYYKEGDIVIAEDQSGLLSLAKITSIYLYPESALPADLKDIHYIHKKFDLKKDFSKYITERSFFDLHVLTTEELHRFTGKYILLSLYDLELDFDRIKVQFNPHNTDYLHLIEGFIRELEVLCVEENLERIEGDLELELSEFNTYRKLSNDIKVYAANLIYEGKYTQKNLDACLRLLEEASYGNERSAHTSLGYLYLENEKLKDYTKAFQNFTIASTLGDINATYKLGDLYYHGLGISRNINMAHKLYLQAYQSDYNNLDTFYDIEPSILRRAGDVYFYGFITDIDYNYAFQLYITAYKKVYITSSRIRHREKLLAYLLDKIRQCTAKLDAQIY